MAIPRSPVSSPLTVEPIRLFGIITTNATFNHPGWPDPRFDALLDRANAAINQSTRYRLYQ